MYSIKFPDMLSSGKTNLIKDHDATFSNLKLILHSCRNTLFGDPYFGSALERFLFDQNNAILRDIIIDEIYTTIKTFIPQILIKRNNIKITSDNTSIYASIDCLNLLNYQNNIIDINLTEEIDRK